MTSRGSHRSCSTDTAIYHDRNHVCRDQQKVFLGSLGQFCAAFYHVPARNYAAYCCLDESQCKIGRRKIECNELWAHPRTVVAVVKCEDKHSRITYEARYTNCYDDKMHAEDYFKLDIERGALRALIDDKKVDTITMYITFQPCHMTVKGTAGARQEHSCCETLLALFRDRQFSTGNDGIEICIKPTHVYKVDWRQTPVDEERNDAIRNAAEGIKMLIKADIEVTRMDESDWEYLLGMVGDRRIIPPYRGSVRETLDREIEKILSDLKMDTALQRPLTHRCDIGFGIYDDCRHILNRQEVSDGNFLGKPAQLCAAFYHIYEGQRAAFSQNCLCLDSHSCFTSRKRRKLRGLYDRPKTMVAVVKCEVNDKVEYEARYTDCCSLEVSAEEFFVRDARKGDLAAAIKRGHTIKITLYTTWPPRHKSTSDTWNPRDHSCCEALVDLYSSRFKRKNIQFLVKLAHVYKEGWPLFEESIRTGIMTLVGNGILVTKMEEFDWDYFLTIARLPFGLYTPPGQPRRAWDWQPRKMLDEATGAFLAGIEHDIRQTRNICSFLLKLSQHSTN